MVAPRGEGASVVLVGLTGCEPGAVAVRLGESAGVRAEAGDLPSPGHPTDVVVLDTDGLPAVPATVVPLKLLDPAPSIIVLAGTSRPVSLAELLSCGCDRVVVKENDWGNVLAREVRSLVRLRRIDEERHALTARLHEANKLLEERNRRLDEFCTVLAHDVRGPLAGVAMKLGFILDGYEGELDPRFAKLLSKALGSTERLTEMVQSLYEFAKLGAKASRIVPVDLTRLVDEVASDLAFQGGHGVELFVEDLPRVDGNPDLLRRLFSNLFTNAVKYGDKDPVLVTVRCAREEERPLGRFVDVVVADNGPGLPPGDPEEMFALFRRGPGTANAPGAPEGLGVGLAVVRRIAELHGGSVTAGAAEEIYGGGAAFTVSLPAGGVTTE